MTVAYVWAKPSRYMELLKIRNNIHNVVDNDHYYRKQRPHITLIPPFKIEEGSKESITEEVDGTELKGTKVNVKGLSVHKNTEEPYAVFITVSIEQQDGVDQLRSNLKNYSTGKVNKGVEPHISLFKTKGWWDEVPEDLSTRLENELEYRQVIDELSIKSVNVNFKR